MLRAAKPLRWFPSKLSRSAGGSPREESRRASEARAACVDALARKIALSSVYGPGLAMALSSSWLAHLAHVVQRPPLQAVNRLYAQAVSRLYAQSGVVRARMSQRGRGDASCAARSDLQQSISNLSQCPGGRDTSLYSV